MDDSPYRVPQNDDGEPSHPSVALDPVRGMQIVTAAMMMGTAVFAGFALFSTQGALGETADLTSWIGIAFGVLMFFIHLIVPGVMRRQQLAQVDAQDFRDADETGRFDLLVGAFRGPHIVACAMLEGAAFFNLVMYMVSEFAGNLVAAVLLLLCIAVRFPTHGRVSTWARNASDEIAMR